MLIAANQVTKFYGKQDIVRRANLHIHRKEKVGLVGPNGSGKSTLLRILLGQIEPDEGEIHVARHARLGYLPQDVLSLKGRTVIDQVLDVAEEVRSVEKGIREIERELDSAAEANEELALRLSQLMDQYHRLGGYDLRPRAEKILMGLGFEEKDFHRPTETLSGGWMMRVALARILLSDPDLLLLDEPTNHLDLEALQWLEQFLVGMEAALLIVSHDRVLLNRVVSRIMELEAGELVSYAGNFDFYRAEKQRRLEQRVAAYRAQQEQLRQMQRFIDRNRARKDRARQVQSRIRSIAKMERVELPCKPQELRFRFSVAPPSGRIVAELEGVCFGFQGKALFEEASLVMERGARVAILGRNGSGKSTLLRILAGELTPQKGARRIGHGVRIAYFSQHQMDQLHPQKTVLEELLDSASHPHQGELRDLLGAFHFRGDSVFKKVAVLSGGEKSRLLLCKLLLAGANLLLLDEPTNHLDISSREVLERALGEFKGSICLVTHDRELMNRVANQILVMQPGGWQLFQGNYQDYEKLWAKQDAQPTPLTQSQQPSRAVRKDKEQKRLEAEWRNRFSRLRAPIQGEIEELERKVKRATERLDEIRMEMGCGELYRCGERARAIHQEFNTLKAKVQKWTQRWEELHLEMEQLERTMALEKPTQRDKV
jgi:ATP-binding cassette subfamily F protein 3